MDSLFAAIPMALVVLILGLVAMFVFKPQWERLLSRAKKVGWLEAADAPAQASEPTAPALPTQPVLVPDTPASRRFTEAIRNIIAPIADSGERERQLIEIAAKAQLDTFLERIAGLLFRSQLEFLRLARSSGDTLSIQQAQGIFEKARADSPAMHANRAFDAWMHFMVSWELIVRGQDSITLAPRGIELLIYIPWSAHPEPQFG